MSVAKSVRDYFLKLRMPIAQLWTMENLTSLHLAIDQKSVGITYFTDQWYDIWLEPR